MSRVSVGEREGIPRPAAKPEMKASAPALRDSFARRAVMVGAASFLVVLGVTAAIGVFSAPPGEPLAAVAAAEREAPPKGDFDNVPLLEDYQFTTTLPPAGDRSITYRYGITVKVVRSRRGTFDRLVAPNRRNMLPVIKETIRKIIGGEDYLKLRSEQLGDVKRRIRQSLNALMDSEVVEDVIFDRWDVIP